MARKMKDSGIAWIGEIPEEWKVSKLHFFVDCYDGKRVPVDAAKRKEGSYPYWGAGNIVDYVNEYLFDEELILLGEDGAPFFDYTRPVAFYVNEKIWVNNHIHVLKPHNETDPLFLVHYLNNVDYKSYINGSILNKLTQSNMNKIAMLVPPLDEQRRIAAFLDEKCVHIDAVIEKTRASIDEYKKLKQAIITRAVTKGLRQGRKMKDSGIEWIGEIPEEWEIKKLGTFGSIKTGPFGTQLKADEYTPTGIPCINVKNVGYGTIIHGNLDYLPNEVISRLSEHKLQTEDIVFARKGSIDKHAIISNEENGWLQGSDCIRVRLEENVNKRFFNYYLANTGIKFFLLVLSHGATMASLNAKMISNLVIAHPPLPEQQEIAAYLDAKTAAIDRLIAKKEQLIAEMESCKKSLIYEVVTGKREVAI